MKKKGILILFPAILYLLFALLMALTISGKVDFYLDEYASYTLANRVANAPADFENYQKYTPAGDVFLKSIVADPARRFDYVSVFANQAADVHPPLYYILLHTICSLFPGTFSKWYAGVINIVFGLLTLFFVRRLARAMVGGTGVFSRVVVALLSVAFVFSAGVYNAVPFLRMYVMAMCWVTAFTYLLADQIGKPHTRRFYLGVFAVAFLGAMTHYYCIVYTVFACAVYGVYLLVHKRWKETGLFAGAMVLAGGVSVAVFPAMLGHMFTGYRGTEAIENLSSLSDYGTRLKNYAGYLSQQLFGGYMAELAVFICLLLVCGLAAKLCRGQAEGQDGGEPALCGMDRDALWKLACAAVPCLLYFLLVSKMSAYISDRYIFPIYAVFLVWVLVLLACLLRAALSQKAVLVSLCALVTVAAINGRNNYTGDYLCQYAASLHANAQAHAGVDAVCLYTDAWSVAPVYQEAAYYGSITFVPSDQLERLPELEAAAGRELVVIMVDVADPEGCAQQIMELCPQFTSVQYLGYGYSNSSYYLSAAE